ncbi:hypothetical protein MXB_443 [Myxobolus squamalis]|nr:hypothetical protein MXB_443 [Myxobolus squamalis]
MLLHRIFHQLTSQRESLSKTLDSKAFLITRHDRYVNTALSIKKHKAEIWLQPKLIIIDFDLLRSIPFHCLEKSSIKQTCDFLQRICRICASCLTATFSIFSPSRSNNLFFLRSQERVKCILNHQLSDRRKQRENERKTRLKHGTDSQKHLLVEHMFGSIEFLKNSGRRRCTAKMKKQDER